MDGQFNSYNSKTTTKTQKEATKDKKRLVGKRSMEDDGDYYLTADVPDSMKGIRACLRCTLLKTFEQFTDAGCENCEFLQLEGNSKRVQEVG